MRKLVKSKLTIDEAYTEVSKGLRAPKKEFWAKNKETLLTAFTTYESKATEGKLIELTPLWDEGKEDTYDIKTKDDTISKSLKHQDISYTMYSPSASFAKKLREELKSLNSEDPQKSREIICPICELNPCRHLDHHAPRAHDKFPEYSACYSNLIPLCSDCNETKHDHWKKKEEGIEKRLWFNPYFDELPNFDIFESRIEIYAALPRITIRLNPALDRTHEIHDVICSTCERLDLIKKYEDHANVQLEAYNEQYKLEFKNAKDRYHDKNDFVNLKYSLINQLLLEGTKQTFIEIMTYKAIISSKEYQDWLIDALKEE